MEVSSGKLHVSCLPCSYNSKKKLIEAGLKEESLTNLKAHIKTSKNVSNLKSMKEDKIISDDQEKLRAKSEEKKVAIGKMKLCDVVSVTIL